MGTKQELGHNPDTHNEYKKNNKTYCSCQFVDINHSTFALMLVSLYVSMYLFSLFLWHNMMCRVYNSSRLSAAYTDSLRRFPCVAVRTMD